MSFAITRLMILSTERSTILNPRREPFRFSFFYAMGKKIERGLHSQVRRISRRTFECTATRLFEFQIAFQGAIRARLHLSAADMRRVSQNKFESIAYIHANVTGEPACSDHRPRSFIYSQICRTDLRTWRFYIPTCVHLTFRTSAANVRRVMPPNRARARQVT